MSEYCEGCRTYTHKKIYNSCSHIDFNQNSECPCSICVVKVMCERSCEVFEDFKTQNMERDDD